MSDEVRAFDLTAPAGISMASGVGEDYKALARERGGHVCTGPEFAFILDAAKARKRKTEYNHEYLARRQGGLTTEAQAH